MHLDIITPEKNIYNDEIEEIVISTADGVLGILPHHVNLFTKVMPGEATIKTKSGTQYLAVTGGFLEVANNKVTILADYAIHAEDINVQKALEAQKRAEEVLKRSKEGLSDQDFAIAEADLRKALLEIKVANTRRGRTSH